MNRRLLLLLLNCVCFVFTQAQDFSNKGTDFWISYPYHIDGTTSVMGIYITSDQNATGTIQVGTQTIPFTVTANNVTRKFLGPNASGDAPNTSVYLTTDEGVTKNAAVHISSDKPVVAYAHIIRSARSGATLLLPSTVWGRQYVIPSYSSSGTGAGAGYGIITVMAKDSNTIVQIKTTAKSKNGKYGAGGIIQTPALNPGDVYQIQFQQNADISGTTVESVSDGTGCKKIAVFSSTSWSAFGCSGSSSGDNLYQQLFPTGAWGKTFLTAPFKNRTSDIIRVYVTDPATVVKKTENNVTVTLTGLYNSYYEIMTGNPTLIEADKPVSVVQYVTTQACKVGCSNSSSTACYADPEMIVINPVEQTINNITVFSAHKNFVPSGQSNVDQCFLNIIIKTSAASSFKINGSSPTASFQQIPGTSYSYLQEDVTNLSASNPVQNLKADSNFIAIAYGFGNVESYGYNAGTNVIDLTQGILLENNYAVTSSASTCTNTASKLSVKFSYQPTSISWDLGNNAGMSVSGVQGPFTNPPDSSFTDAISGKTIYVYSLPTKISFSATGMYNFNVTSNNPTSDGCSGVQQQTYSITVYSQPTANFIVKNNGCVSDSLTLIDSSKGYDRTLKQWLWDFKDNTGSSLQNPKKLYAAAGTYNISLRAVNDLGCYADTSFSVSLSSKPSFSLAPQNPICTNTTVQITNNTTIAVGNIVKWNWDYGNGSKDSSVTKQNGSQVYTTSGIYSVKLTTLSNTGCVSTDSVSVKVNPVPVAYFLLPDVCLNDAFANFTDSSYFKEATTSTLSYAWNFGDAASGSQNIAALQNPKHKYNSVGIYKVKLNITSSDGCIDSIQRNLTVNGAVPKADFQFVQNTKICSNQAVQIKNTSTVDFGEITRIEIIWDTSDPNAVPTVDEQPVLNKIYSNTYKTFNSPANKTYTIRMRSFSGGSCLNDVTKTVTVYSLPKLSFSTMKGICLNAASITLTQAKETAGNAGTFAYSGNGITTAGGNFDPSVAGTGVQTVKYTYTTNDGCIDSIKSDIKVFKLPVASFSIQLPSCDNNTATFKDASTSAEGNIVQWQWDYGDNKTKTAANNIASELYPSAGNYTVTLKVVSDSACTSAADTKVVTVSPLPIPDFDLPGNVCLPAGTATFTNKTTISDGSQASITYVWNFGDVANNSSVMKDPVHNYSSTGTKTIKLIATSNKGCIDSISKQLPTIYAQPKANAAVAKNEGCVNESFSLNGSAQNVNGSIISYHWNIGNTPYTTQNISASFNSAGSYTANFFITDAKGCNSDTASQTLIINNYPTLNDMPTLYVLEGGSTKLQPNYSGNIIDIQWTPLLYLDSPKIASPTATPLQTTTYTLTLTGKGDCAVNKSVIVKVLEAPEVPNVFSPNNDGTNDTWMIQHLSSYPECTVDVFDRYGSRIYHSKGYNTPWDGTLNGKPLDTGTYYYIIDPKRGRPKVTGSVTIIR